jgi:hypothetical protein
MSEPATEVAAEDAPLTKAADNARRGVVTHLTIHGERVAVIVPDSVIEALGVLTGILTSEQTAKILPAAIPAAIPWTRSLPQSELPILAAELAEAAAAGPDAPDLIATLIRDWQATAEAYADPEILAALTSPPVDCGPVPEPAE